MRAWVFVFLFGAVAILGIFLTVFWSDIARRRAKRIAGRWSWGSDRYFVLAASNAVIAAGCVPYFGARAAGNLRYGLSPILRDNWEAIGIAAGAAIILLGMAMLVWLADLEREPPVWSWTRILSAITVAWGMVAVVLSAYMPLG